MGYSPLKKALKNKQSRVPLISRIHDRWRHKWPVLIVVLVFAVLMVIFYSFWLSDYCQSNLQPGIVSVNASISSFILNLFGMKTFASKETVSSLSFSVNIARGCDAVEAMALFASAMLAFPAKWNYKVIGFFAGIAMLFLLNILRVISLFLTGIYFPKAFEIMHVEVWQVLFIVFAIVILILWIKWTGKGAAHAE